MDKVTFVGSPFGFEDRDFILISHPIDRAIYELVSQVISTQQVNTKCTVYLSTYGGDAHCAFRIGRCLQHHYEHIRVVVPRYCKSAGTLICVAANELGIVNLGELGPLDVQLIKKDEVGDRNSGLDITEAMGIIDSRVFNFFISSLLQIKQQTQLSTKIAGDFAAKLSTSIFNPLYSQIDPVSLGSSQRETAVAWHYGLRLAQKSGSINEQNLLQLISGYPSHFFVIDRAEAKLLFNKVTSMSKAEEAIPELLNWGVPIAAPQANNCVELISGENIANTLQIYLQHENTNQNSTDKPTAAIPNTDNGDAERIKATPDCNGSTD